MIRCVKCGKVETILKAGFLRGKQRFFCKECNFHFIQKPLLVEDEQPSQKKKRQTTIIDIAKALGISNSTVSRALHGHPEVNPETRKAVIEIANHLDYQPNQLAYNLVKSKTNVIGILVPELYHVFFPSVIMGVQEVISKAGYNLMIMHSDESYLNEVANSKTLLASKIDGLLVSLAIETNNFDHLRAFEKRGIPLVLFNRVCDELETPKVIVDDYGGAFAAVEHLIVNGYKRIAHLAGPPSLTLSQERLRGYIDALKKYNMQIENDLIINFDLTETKARIYAKHLLELANPPDAIFAVNDPSAIEVISLAKSLGINIPNDLGVVGFSNDPISKYIEPGLTTVSQPTLEMGKVAANMVLELIKTGNLTCETNIQKLSTKLIIRQSTCKV